MNNTIYLKRKRKVFLEKEENILPNDYLFNMLKNIESLGFTFSSELLETVRTLRPERFRTFYKQLIKDLNDMVGDYVDYQPMYPNFPEQVVETELEELYNNAFWHYLGDHIHQRIIPKYEIKERPALKDEVILKVIELGSKKDFNAIFTRLLGTKSSVSGRNKNDLEWFIKNYNTKIFDFTPHEIPIKENAAFFIAVLLKNNIDAGKVISQHIKTATDILRVATAYSDGDISLAQNTKFKNLPKRYRRLLLQTLENIGSITEDMLRYKNRWKRLGEILHPFEYKKQFPQCCEAFDIIRNDKPFETFNSLVEKSLLKNDVPQALNLLKNRPGELARRLDHLIRISEQPESVVAEFKNVAISVSNPVLIQVKAHFEERNQDHELRVFFPKGNVNRAMAIDNNLPKIDETITREIAKICEESLIEKFSQYPPLGKVYIAKELKDYSIPFGQRSASKALNTIPAGSRVDLPKGDTIRFFIYWKDGDSRTDLDLSALALDTDSIHKFTVAYYNLKENGVYHSGDITSAPDGASEFIDIHIPQCLEQGVRYVMMNVNSYTWQAYKDLPHCFAGFMMRQFPESGEIYEPLTVENRFDLTADTKIAIPLIIDLQERKIIWADLSLTANPSANNNVHNNLSSLSIINKALTSQKKPNLYDLYRLHAKARGEETLDIQAADTIFALNKGIKPSNIDIILSEYL